MPKLFRWKGLALFPIALVMIIAACGGDSEEQQIRDAFAELGVSVSDGLPEGFPAELDIPNADLQLGASEEVDGITSLSATWLSDQSEEELSAYLEKAFTDLGYTVDSFIPGSLNAIAADGTPTGSAFIFPVEGEDRVSVTVIWNVAI
ncbi:MAG TPA: hypothetical protein QGF05_01345 [Dehalococcoidia bacterium]|nr:hypothetical protein [Dehalococcoidia bacterium]